MNTDYELIHRLALEELADVISDEDLVYLKKTIREDPEAFNVWFETRNILNEPDVKEFLERSRPVEMIFQATLKDKKRPGFWKFYLLSLAAVILIGLCLFHFYYHPLPRLPVTKTLIDSNGVRLQLPNQENINLSIGHGSFKTSNVTLQNNGDSMTYTTNSTSIELAKITVPQGKDYKIKLTDGSLVWLNSTTSLQFPLTFPKEKREISINGEAFIEVAQSTKPFFVKLPNTTIQVLGTSFNVNTFDSNKVQVALVNGALKVLNETGDLILKPGQQVTHTSFGMNVTTFDDSILSWRQGLYIFNNKPLSEILQIIPRWFGKEVVMDNPAKKQSRFTGVINRYESMEQSLNILKATNDFDYYVQGNVLHIK